MASRERLPSRTDPGWVRSPVIRKLSAAAELDPDAISLLSGLHEKTRVAPRNQDVVTEGEENGTCYLILDGWACRYKLLPDGRRQILTFVLPGDIIGLQDSVAHVADDTFAALTNVVVCSFPSQVIQEIRRQRPSLSAALDWTLSRDHAILGERLLSLGRRTAFEALAHLLLELYDRLTLVGLASDHSYRLPVTQEALADALGLTVVHVNRTLRKIEKARLATVKHQRAVLHDLDRLIVAAGVDPDVRESLGLGGRLRAAPPPPRNARGRQRTGTKPPDGPGQARPARRAAAAPAASGRAPPGRAPRGLIHVSARRAGVIQTSRAGSSRIGRLCGGRHGAGTERKIEPCWAG